MCGAAYEIHKLALKIHLLDRHYQQGRARSPRLVCASKRKSGGWGTLVDLAILQTSAHSIQYIEINHLVLYTDSSYSAEDVDGWVEKSTTLDRVYRSRFFWWPNDRFTSGRLRPTGPKKLVHLTVYWGGWEGRGVVLMFQFAHVKYWCDPFQIW